MALFLGKLVADAGLGGSRHHGDKGNGGEDVAKEHGVVDRLIESVDESALIFDRSECKRQEHFL